MKKIVLPVMIGLSLVLSACGEQMKTEEIYQEALESMEQLKSATFERNQTLRAQNNSFRSQMNAVIQYEPLNVYATVQMTPLNVNEPLQLEMSVTEDEWNVRSQNAGASWEEQDRSTLDDVIFTNPVALLSVFQPYQGEFLMKESEIRDFNDEEQAAEEEEEDRDMISVYEISFRGSDEVYKPLVQQHIEQMGLVTEHDVNMNEVLDTVEIERIDMTVFVDQETYDVHRFQTRFRYSADLLGERRVIDESLLLRFTDHNEDISIPK